MSADSAKRWNLALLALTSLLASVVAAQPAAALTVAAIPSDFDGDGYADLAVGVPGEDVGAAGRHAGAVNVLYGSPTGLTAVGDQLWSQATTGIKGGRHLRHEKPVPLANLHLTLLDKAGVHLDKFGDSQGTIGDLFDAVAI